MIILRPSEIYISTANVDMRKSIDGLASVVQQQFRLDPVSDAMFVFHNRHCDKIKILYWDKEGFCLLYKRMERGKFRFPTHIKGDTYNVTEAELYWLLHGLHIEEIKHYESLKPSFECSVFSQTPTGKMTETQKNSKSCLPLNSIALMKQSICSYVTAVPSIRCLVKLMC